MPVPPPEDQKEIFKNKDTQDDSKEGDLFYIVDGKWMKKWKVYVGYDDEKDQAAGAPGAIDNKSLILRLLKDLSGNETVILKDGLQDGEHYEIVTADCWKFLQEWYGGGPEIPRTMVADGEDNQYLRVEVYPYVLQLYRTFDTQQTAFVDTNSKEEVVASKKAKVKELKAVGAKLYKVSSPSQVRMWDYLTESIKLIEKEDVTLEDARIVNNHRILFEIPYANDKWPFDALLAKKQQQQQQAAAKTETPKEKTEEEKGSKSLSDKLLDGVKNLGISFGGASKPGSVRKGVTGLYNLGNTCFMNSALQCLSNTKELTEYFLAGTWKIHLNKENPLGTKGVLAKEYAGLIKELWSGGSSAISPGDLKYVIGKKAPQFSGYNQHDAQELLAFLLDGLHEDLNQIKKKPLVVQSEGDGKVSDEEIAEISWKQHLSRNKSVVVEMLQGQLKSTLTCNMCNKISIKFDPFMYLSTPIPSTTSTPLEVIFLNTNIDDEFPVGEDEKPGKGPEDTRPTKYTVDISLSSSIEILKMKFKNYKPSEIALADMWGNRVSDILPNEKSIGSAKSKQRLLMFRVPQNKKYVMVRVTQRKPTQDSDIPIRLCGIPFVIYVPPKSTGEQIYAAAWKLVERYSTSKQPYPFKLSFINDQGFKCNNPSCQDTNCFGTPISNDSSTYDIPPNTFIGLDWNSVEMINVQEQMTVLIDESSHNHRNKITQGITLQDCLHLFEETEQLGSQDLWYCPRCKEHRRAFKKFEIWSVPNILIIHLKRFSFQRYYRSKISIDVDFPLDNLDMSPFMVTKPKTPVIYELYAISNHLGELGGGHYTAYAKNFLDNRWYCFDDSRVTPIDISQIRKSAAYVLFYRRKDVPAAATPLV